MKRLPFVGILIITSSLLLAMVPFGAMAEDGDGQPFTSWLALMELLPDREDASSEVWMNDYVLASQAMGIRRPGPEANHETVLDYVVELSVEARTGEAPYITGFGPHAIAMPGFEALQEQAGYDSRNVIKSVVAGQPPHRYNVVLLDLPSESVMHHILESGHWPPPHMSSFEGIDILAWGEDHQWSPETRHQPPVFDTFGRGARLAFLNGVMLQTYWIDGLKEMIRAKTSEDAPSLADREDFALLARALSALDVYSVFLTDQTQGQTVVGMMGTYSSSEAREAVQEELLDGPGFLQPYRAFATSIGVDTNGFFMGLVLVHDTPEAASENAVLLGNQLQHGKSFASSSLWSEIYNADRVEIRHDGRILAARVPIRGGQPPSVWIDWVLRRDLLLPHL